MPSGRRTTTSVNSGRYARHRIVEVEPPLLEQHHHGDRRDRLGHRVDAEERALAHRRARCQILIADRRRVREVAVAREHRHGTGSLPCVDMRLQHGRSRGQRRRADSRDRRCNPRQRIVDWPRTVITGASTTASAVATPASIRRRTQASGTMARGRLPQDGLQWITDRSYFSSRMRCASLSVTYSAPDASASEAVRPRQLALERRSVSGPSPLARCRAPW